MGSTAGALMRWPLPAADQWLLVRLRGTLALAALALLIFLAIVFAARRLAGGLERPLGGLSLVVVAVVVGGMVVGIQRGLMGRTSASTEYSVLSTQYLTWVVASAAAAVMLAALTMRGTPAWGIACAWFAFVSFALLMPHRISRRLNLTPPDIEEADLDAPPANLVQQLTRQRDKTGGETLHALAEAAIPAGDRVAVLHLAFCPPLASVPQLTAHAIDADDAEVKITTAESYGARLEVRLPKTAAQPRWVLIEVFGSMSSPIADGASL